MDTSVLGLDLPVWVSWTSDVVYVASVCLVVLAVVLVGCMVGQSMTDVRHAEVPKRRAHVAH